MVFVDESSDDRRPVALKTRDAAVEATCHYLDQVPRVRVSVRYMSVNVAGELGRPGKSLKMLLGREMR